MFSKIFTLTMAIVWTTLIYGQNSNNKVEVYYFKANLSCCQAKLCNSIEADIQKVIKTKFSGKDVVFKEIKISDDANKEIIKKYNAKSQTVIIVATKNGKQNNTDISKIIKDYSLESDFPRFEKELTASINASLK